MSYLDKITDVRDRLMRADAEATEVMANMETVLSFHKNAGIKSAQELAAMEAHVSRYRVDYAATKIEAQRNLNNLNAQIEALK